MGFAHAAKPGAIFEFVFLEGAAALLAPLKSEAGGHRWQRVPPNERKGRVHSSSVTVAVFEGHAAAPPGANLPVPPREIQERITRGQGPGGQNRNKRETCVVLRHLPTGIEVKAEVERTQEANRRVALATLQQRVAEHYAQAAKTAVDQQRKRMVGSGERGDKVRTYRADGVTDHISAKRAPLSLVKAGKLELLRP